MVDLTSPDPTVSALPPTALVEAEFGISTSAYAANKDGEQVLRLNTEAGDISITKRPYSPRSAAQETRFSRIEARHVGVDRPNLFGVGDMMQPHYQAPGSIAAADMDNDADVDVVLADIHGGIRIFLNDGTGKFQQHDLEAPFIDKLPVLLAAPADINNDGCLDLILTTFYEGEHVLLNDGCKLNFSKPKRLKNKSDARFTISLTFGDLDKNGWLDVLLGNSSTLPGYFKKEEYGRNRLLSFSAKSFVGEDELDTEGHPGNTLSALLSDINLDGNLDLIETNDFSDPDNFYLGDSKGNLTRLTAKDQAIPHSTMTTMSVKSADLNNDLKLEVYLSQISGMATALEGQVNFRIVKDYCEEIERPMDKYDCQKNMEIHRWFRVGQYYPFKKSLVRKCGNLYADDGRSQF